MKGCARFALAVVLLMAVAAAAGAARVDDSLAALRAQRDPGDHFDFVVASDLHSAGNPVSTAALRATMSEIALLHPELVVATGDLIHGNKLEELLPEWEANLSDTALCGAPLFPVPGNHDITGPQAETAWKAVNGPMRYSFDRGNCHFVVLNSIEPGGPWGDAALTWLKADLAASKAQNIFVFLHYPSWADDPRWQRVQEVLRAYPVRIVFAGHTHDYRKYDPVDGIQYVTTSAASKTFASPADLGDLATGDFRGYLLVRVHGADVSYAVVRAGSIFPPDVSLQSVVTEPQRVARENFQMPVLDYAYGEAVDTTARVVISNPYPKPLASKLTWDTPPGWEVTPKAREYQAPADGRVSLAFRVRAAHPSAVKYPTPTLVTEYRYGADQEKKITVRRRMELRPSLAITRAARPITVDAKLDEWAGLRAVPLLYPKRILDPNTPNLGAKVQVQWDERNLYLAVTVRDNAFYQPFTGDGMWLADCLQAHFDVNDDGSGDGQRRDDYEYGIALTPGGPEVWVWLNPQDYEGPAGDIQLAVSRSGDITTYEAAIPASRLAPLKLDKGTVLGFNIAVHDKDGPESGRLHWWVDLLPGAGDGAEASAPMRLLLQ